MAKNSEPKTRTVPADDAGIGEALALLDAGQVVAIPTETVYGLGADAANSEAVARIYAAKGRPRFNPLIVHVGDTGMGERYAVFPPLAHRLAARFWPGPLTMVMERRADAQLSPLLLAGLPTVAVRVPAHAVMQRLLLRFGRGIAAPSANASGRISPTRAGHVIASLGGRIPLLLDAGPTPGGIESTIVAFAGGQPVLLRPGAIAAADIEAAAGVALAAPLAGGKVVAPGMTRRHYAPRLPIRLEVTVADAGEFHIGFGKIAGDANLSAAGDSVEAAARLYELLHRADASGRRGIAVAPVPDTGLGAAINDRLRRAAA